MSIFNEFAKLIGVEPRLAEDALHSERAARHVLSRRGMLGVAAAMATGLVIGEVPAPTTVVKLYNVTFNMEGWVTTMMHSKITMTPITIEDAIGNTLRLRSGAL